MRALPALLAATALLAGACSDDGPISRPLDDDGSESPGDLAGDDGNARSGDGRSGDGGARFVRALRPFADCSAFIDHVRAAALERVGPYGLDGGGGYWIAEDVALEEMAVDDVAVPAEAPASEPADEPAGGDAGSDPSYTGTNVQELGIDEPDIIKTDGERILVISNNVLTYVDLTDGDPRVAGELSLPEGWGHELFFSGDRAFVLTNGGGWAVPMPVEPLVDAGGDAEAQFADAAAESISPYPPEYQAPAAVILEIDLTDPRRLHVAATLTIEGQYLSARAIGDRVRLAVTSPPQQLPWVYPQSPAGEDRAEQTNREIVEQSTLDDWIPGYEVSASGGTSTGPLLACDRVHHPAEFSGFDMITVVDLDLATGIDDGFTPREAVGVLASGQTVYSSNDRFYVATTKWAGADLVRDDDRFRDWTDDYETDLHAFAISTDAPTEYVASGSVAGTLLNQFSLDEHEGHLRVITTDGSPWDERNRSESVLTVFAERGDTLEPVGRVGGLGKGEQLFSARLMDDIGFAVTFRQIDPFYVLDLSEPTEPRVVGELKIPGFSTYLHPVGDRHVLGIGQAATEEGVPLGLKLSLFDVSDPADPREVSVWTMEGATSPVEHDHRAFQMWGSTAIVPVQSWAGDVTGAVLFDIGDTIAEIGRIDHVGDVVDSSDCRPVDPDALTPESELFWMARDGHVQVCDADDRGGWGGWYCDPIPARDLVHWYRDPATAEAEFAAIGLSDDGRVEICWPDGYYHDAIQRSLVIGGTLWTMSPTTLQGNLLDGLAVTARIDLR